MNAGLKIHMTTREFLLYVLIFMKKIINFHFKNF